LTHRFVECFVSGGTALVSLAAAGAVAHYQSGARIRQSLALPVGLKVARLPLANENRRRRWIRKHCSAVDEARSRPLNQPLIRRLMVLKLWQGRDSFDPARLMQKFRDGREFDWDDLAQLVRRTMAIDRERSRLIASGGSDFSRS
jgi:hypothetical protein